MNLIDPIVAFHSELQEIRRNIMPTRSFATKSSVPPMWWRKN